MITSALHGLLEQGGGGWAPTELPGLKHYLNADFGVNVDGSNGVNFYTDTFNGRTWTNISSSGAKALYEPAGFDGKAGIRFTSNDATPQNTARLRHSDYVNFGKVYTIFELCKLSKARATFAGGSYSEGGYFLYIDGSGTYHSANSGYGLWGSVASSSHEGTSKIRQIIRSGASAELLIDNVSYGTQTLSGNEDLAILTIGSFNEGNNGSDGLIRIQLVINRLLTTEENAQVYSFLNANK